MAILNFFVYGGIIVLVFIGTIKVMKWLFRAIDKNNEDPWWRH